MAVAIFFVWVLPLGYGCNANTAPKSRVKVVEDYVLSTDFNRDLPQIRSRGRIQDSLVAKIGTEGRITREDSQRKVMEDAYFRPEHDHTYPTDGDTTGVGAYYGGSDLKERDLVLPSHHHHHHPPPPPPPPIGVTPYSVFAVGFISFLILLSGLQSSLTMLTTSNNNNKGGGLLGGLTKPSRRRRRSRPGPLHLE